MTGICGIRPDEGSTLVIRPLGTALDYFTVTDVHYHGHTLDIVWNKAEGLRVTVDGQEKAFIPATETAEAPTAVIAL